MSAALVLKNSSFVRRASSDGITETLSYRIEGSGTEEVVCSDDELLNEELQPGIAKRRSPRSSGMLDPFQSNIAPSLYSLLVDE